MLCHTYCIGALVHLLKRALLFHEFENVVHEVSIEACCWAVQQKEPTLLLQKINATRVPANVTTPVTQLVNAPKLNCTQVQQLFGSKVNVLKLCQVCLQLLRPTFRLLRQLGAIMK